MRRLACGAERRTEQLLRSRQRGSAMGGSHCRRPWRRHSRRTVMSKGPLGRSELNVGPLCRGGTVFGWTADKAMSFRLLDRALEAGLDFIDTAEMYSVWVPGHRC